MDLSDLPKLADISRDLQCIIELLLIGLHLSPYCLFGQY